MSNCTAGLPCVNAEIQRSTLTNNEVQHAISLRLSVLFIWRYYEQEKFDKEEVNKILNSASEEQNVSASLQESGSQKQTEESAEDKAAETIPEQAGDSSLENKGSNIPQDQPNEKGSQPAHVGKNTIIKLNGQIQKKSPCCVIC